MTRFLFFNYHLAMRSSAKDGFTFLEVMIAVAIIAIAFVALLGSQSQSVSVASDLRERVTASFLAQQKLAELESSDFDSLFTTEGLFGDEFSQFGWSAEVNILSPDETGIEESDDMLKTIDLTITMGDTERPVYSLRSVVMKKIDLAGN